jgi:hypothetical protein
MAQATESISRKIRFPVEMLQGIEEWAAAHDMSRSKAVRVLIYRGLSTDYSDFDGCTCEDPKQCAGTCKFCDCIGGPDTRTNNCR